MATTITFNGASYSIPALGDSNWGDNVSNYLIAIATGSLQKTGGAFTLTSEIDFGATYGIKAPYFTSKATNPSATGAVRLGNTQSIGWRNAGNSADLSLSVSGLDVLTFGGTKVLLSGGIVDADISALAAIALSKLAAVTADRVIVSNGSGVLSASSTTTTTLGYLDVGSSLTTLLAGKEPTITQLPINKGGTNSVTALNNNRVMQSNAGAIVEAAAITAARALISDANGIPTHSTVTSTELGYVSGVTSAIQTQINSKEPTITTLPISKGGTNSSTALNNNRIMQSSGGSVVESSAITANRALISDSNGIPTHSTVTNTELGYVSGVTSALQTQLNAKAPLVSPSFTTPNIGAATGTSLVVGTSPSLDASAALEVDSTTKGFLPPRMTQTQRDAISTPATGLTIFNTDTNKVNVYNGASWGEVGSGQGGINYIGDTDGSVLGSWATYADAAGTSPVDGTGGSPTVTFATSSSSAMRGNSNFLFTHGASNQQGQGFSYLCSIDPSDRGKVIRFNFEYLVASGTYADGDLTVWFYDVTNGAVIQGAPTSILNSQLIERYQSEVQVPITCAQMRVIIHVTTTTATAYTMRFENFIFGPSEKLYGPLMTDSDTTWLPTVIYDTGGATNVNWTGSWMRVGEKMKGQVRGYFTGTSAAFTIPKIALPNNLQINTTKLPIGANGFEPVGIGAAADAGTGNYPLIVTTAGTYLVVDAYSTGATYASNFNLSNTVPFTFTTGDTISFNFEVPIVGWSSSSQVVSDNFTGREISALYMGTSQAVPNGVDSVAVEFSSAKKDTIGMYIAGTGYNSGTGAWTTKPRFQIKSSGSYRMNFIIGCTTVSGSADYFAVAKQFNSANSLLNQISGNRTNGTSGLLSSAGGGIFSCNAGDYVTIEVYQSTGSARTLVAEERFTNVSIAKLESPSQVLAGEKVVCRATMSNNPIIPNNTPAAVIFDTKVFDSHNAYSTSTGLFTAPVSGTYWIYSRVEFDTNPWGAGTGTYFYTRGNASGSTLDAYTFLSAGTVYIGIKGGTLVRLLAGQTAGIEIVQSRGNPTSIRANTSTTYFEIYKVGNY